MDENVRRAGTTLQGRVGAPGLRKMVLPGTNRLASSAHLPRTGWLPIPATTLSPLLHHSSGVAAPFTLVAKGPRPAFSTTFTSSSSQTTYSAKVQKKRRYFAKFVRQEIWSAKVQTCYFSSSLCTFLYACHENQIFGNLQFNHIPYICIISQIQTHWQH